MIYLRLGRSEALFYFFRKSKKKEKKLDDGMLVKDI